MAGARSTVNDYTDAQVTEAGAVKVYVRLRPPDGATAVPARYYKLDEDQPSRMTIKSSPTSQHLFAFNRVYGPHASQEEVFTETSQRLCDHVLEGYNACCFAYGQTGSGKTYTMFGSEKGDAPGLIPRAVDYIFRVLKTRSHAKDSAVVISFLEVYMDRVRDLGIASAEGGHVAAGAEAGETARRPPPRPDSALRTARPDTTSDTTKWFEEAGKVTGTFGRRAGSDASMDYGARYAKQSLEVREDAAGNVYVEGLTVLSVANAEQALEVVRRGMGLRATHDTRMNAVSSRSHTVLTLHVLQKDRRTGQTVDGMLNLVDLAGSERLKRSESEGMRQAEARFINSSLTALGKVVIALQGQTLTAAGPAAVAADPSMRGTTADGGHVPYRDSKLTRLLQNSLGGNSFTVLLATVHPRGEDVEESLSSLQFAHRCRSVINRPKVNVTLRDDEDKDRRIRQLEGANAMLRRQLAVARVTTRLRIMRLMADVGASGRILSDGRFRLSDGRVLGLTLRQAMRSPWARQAIAAALAPGGPYSSEGVARAAASAAASAAAGGDGAAAAAARADDMLAHEMAEPEGVAPLEARHALEAPPMTAEERAEAEKEEAGLEAEGRAAQQARMGGGTAGPASAAGAGEAMLPRHRSGGGGAEAEAFRALTSGQVSWDDASRSRTGLASAGGLFGGGGASGRLGGTAASGAGGGHSDEVVAELKARVAELTKQLKKEQARTASEAGTLRGLARDQRERAAEARAVAESSTRAARDEVERTSSSYARQVASLMAQSQTLLHDQHELVAAVPKSLRVAESALQEAAAVEERVREEEAALRRQAVANAQQAARRELAQAAQSHRQTTKALAEDSARMAAEFRAWSARAREREVGLESEVRSIWEYAAGLGQVVRELEEGRFAVEVSAAGRRVFRVPPQLLPEDPFEAHPTGLPHLRRLLEREAIETGQLTPDEQAEDLGATSGSAFAATAGSVRGGVTGGTGRSSRGGAASLKSLPRGLRKPPARPAGSSPDPSDAEAKARALDAGLRGRAPAARPPAGGVHVPRPELDGMSGAASLSRSVRAGGGGGKSAWSSKRRGGSHRRGGRGPGTGYAAASALQQAVGARGRSGSADAGSRGAAPDVTDGAADDSGEDDVDAADSGLELPLEEAGAEGKDGSARTSAVRSASREKRLQRLERELDARAKRGDVDLEADPATMEPDLLRAHVNALRRYIESGLRRRVEEEIVNDLAEQPSIDYVRTLEQQRDAARGRLEEEVAKARDLQIAYNALRRQLERAGRATLGAPPADEQAAAMLIARAGIDSRAGARARRSAESTVRATSRGSAASGQLPPLGSSGVPRASGAKPLPTGALGPQRGGAARRGFDQSLARGLAHSQSASEIEAAKRKRAGRV
ncbi:hypothetical protein FNF29_07126 [Cafeteria roenbergensis]|uniref:Kinesin motor domain-containing protein n=1 Tax=Cafeteria roenbergensis TaxID=33653 RepID=A0A5A8C7C6_CAFRO|nr:hypothetical protein FNF29_07126 [Cafeteria roenbergensis]|eukprot:KAA0147781.1 hypothetical protein FNF29_07126 [Cafeteria roenbergensis]